MTPEELDEVIRKSQESVEAYPEWIRKNMVFQGGGDRRGEDPQDVSSYGNY